MGSPATHPDEGTYKSQLLPEGTFTDPKYSRRNIQLTDRGMPSTNVTNQSRVGTKYQVDKTQSTRFKVSHPDQNKGNTSSKVKPDNQPLIQTFRDFQILMKDFDDELKDLSDDDIFQAGEEMEDAFPLPGDEESQPHPSTDQQSIE
ncbi:hypothetical protein Tco_1404809 [Tanacetum coccineum]